MPVVPAIAAIGTVASAGSSIASAFGKKKQGETVTADQMIPDFQKLAGSQLGEWITKYLPSYKPAEAYGGRLTTETTPQEKSGLSLLDKFISGANLGDLFNQGKAQISDTLAGKFADPNTSPFIQSMTKLANQNLQDAITTERGQRGARGTYYTKAGIDAEGELQERTLNNLQGIVGSFINDERNRMFQAAPVAQVLDQYENVDMPLQKIGASQTYGGLQRTIDMANIEKQYQDFLRQREESAMPVAAAQSLYGTEQPYGLKSFQMPSEPNSLQNILGLVGKLNFGGLNKGNNIWQNLSGLFTPKAN